MNLFWFHLTWHQNAVKMNKIYEEIKRGRIKSWWYWHKSTWFYWIILKWDMKRWHLMKTETESFSITLRSFANRDYISTSIHFKYLSEFWYLCSIFATFFLETLHKKLLPSIAFIKVSIANAHKLLERKISVRNSHVEVKLMRQFYYVRR